MDYKSAIQYIHDSYRFGIKLGLDNMRTLLESLGNPQANLKFIHIAGTNGKGSTASFITQTLQEAGYRVGKYISPYIEVFNERIQINNQLIADDELADCTAIVKAAIDKLQTEQGVKPTEFEIVTAIGFIYFARQAVDFVVLEVGLGGRYDATNVIAAPLVTVITNIAMDHTQYLGDTIEAIAREKAGIIKDGAVVISAQKDARAQTVIAEVAAAQNAPLKEIPWRSAQVVTSDYCGTDFYYLDQRYHINLLGLYQVQNACLAIEVLNQLSRQGVAISRAHVINGLKNTKWRGRYELIAKNPTVIIDGAHNVDGMAAFAQAIDHYDSGNQRIGIFGMMADKEIDAVIGYIVDRFTRLYLIEPPNPRALPLKQLERQLRVAGYTGSIVCLKDLDQIVEVIVRYHNQAVTIYGFGSLYFIGEMRKRVLSIPK